MRVGDIVKVTDWSYCRFYDGDGRGLRDVGDYDISHRRWKVLATHLQAPTEEDHNCPSKEPNDLMLREIGRPGNILFTHSRSCVPAETTGPRKQPGPARITVPLCDGTTELVITFK